MVIGSGMIAQGFSYYENDPTVVIFAAGVSDSTCTIETEYTREIHLVEEVIKKYPDVTFVYFSTTAVKDPDLRETPYVKHKLFMGEKIAGECKNFLLLRVSNVVGPGGNEKNLLSYFVNKIRRGEKFEVWKNSYRNLIGVEELFLITKHLISDKSLLNQTIDIVAPQSIRVVDLVEHLGQLLRIKPVYDLVDRGASPEYDHEISNRIIQRHGLNMGKEYQNSLIKRYLREMK